MATIPRFHFICGGGWRMCWWHGRRVAKRPTKCRDRERERKATERKRERERDIYIYIYIEERGGEEREHKREEREREREREKTTWERENMQCSKNHLNLVFLPLNILRMKLFFTRVERKRSFRWKGSLDLQKSWDLGPLDSRISRQRSDSPCFSTLWGLSLQSLECLN